VGRGQLGLGGVTHSAESLSIGAGFCRGSLVKVGRSPLGVRLGFQLFRDKRIVFGLRQLTD
jgi:hypothetical protein